MIISRKVRAAGVAGAVVLSTLGAVLTGTAAADPGYQVTGTNGLGVNEHTFPSVDAPVFGALPDGAAITITCQTVGGTVTDPVTGVSSDIWDDVGSAGGGSGAGAAFFDLYISDLYATTPVTGDFSPGIPECNNGVATPGPN
jgi:hypothetical protein